MTAAAEEAKPVLYKGMTLIDGSGAPPRLDMAIITQGERIVLVFPAKQLEIMKLTPMDVVEAGGLSALPGPVLPAEDVNAGIARGRTPKQAVLDALGGRCIRAGVVADILFLRGNPIEDREALGRVAFTVRRGIRSTPSP